MRMASLTLLFSLLAWSTTTRAHLDLLEPAARYARNELKDGPCGLENGERGEVVATYEAGETVSILIEEYVDHPSHYRVALDPSGTDSNLSDPRCMDNCDDNRQGTPVFEDPSEVMVLGVFEDEDAEEQRLRVTIPDVECERCTLQVMQIMYDKRPYTIGGNDNYYHCADIRIMRGEGAMDAGVDMGVADSGVDASVPEDADVPRDAFTMPGDSSAPDAAVTEGEGGCSTAPAGAFSLVFLALLGLRRRS